MALDAINEIRKAEEKAEKIILDAKEKAKVIVNEAKIEAEKQYDDTISISKVKAAEIMNDAVEKGNNEASPILEKGKEDVDAISNMSQKIKDNAINIVVERIVKIHGNS